MKPFSEGEPGSLKMVDCWLRVYCLSSTNWSEKSRPYGFCGSTPPKANHWNLKSPTLEIRNIIFHPNLHGFGFKMLIFQGLELIGIDWNTCLSSNGTVQKPKHWISFRRSFCLCWNIKAINSNGKRTGMAHKKAMRSGECFLIVNLHLLRCFLAGLFHV